jgi:hypothetical protein
VTAIHSRGCFQYLLTDEQVELLSKVAFLETNKLKISSNKLHRCIPILVNLYKIIIRYQRRINRDFTDAKPQTEQKEPAEDVQLLSGKEEKAPDSILETKVKGQVLGYNKVKFEKFEYMKEKEIKELEKELDEVSTEISSVATTEMEQKAKKYDDLQQRKQLKREKRRQQLKKKMKEARNKKERKNLLKQHFLIAKNAVSKSMLDGFDFSVKNQYMEHGLAGYLAIISNREYIERNNLDTKRELKERIKEFELHLPEEEKKLLSDYRTKNRTKEAIELVKNALQLQQHHKQVEAEMKQYADKARKIREEECSQLYKIGRRIISKEEFESLNNKTQERMKPYVKKIKILDY